MKTPRWTDAHKFSAPYVPSGATEISKTFARERKRLAEQADLDKQTRAEATVKVRKIKDAK